MGQADSWLFRRLKGNATWTQRGNEHIYTCVIPYTKDGEDGKHMISFDGRRAVIGRALYIDHYTSRFITYPHTALELWWDCIADKGFTKNLYSARQAVENGWIKW